MTGSRRLGRYMIDRRTELGFDKREPWAAHVKISSKTLSWYERGERLPGDESVAILERALGWEPGSIDAIVAGGTPILRRSEQAGAAAAVPLSPEDELQEAVLNARRRLPPDKFHEMIGKVIADLLASRSDADRYGDTDTPAG